MSDQLPSQLKKRKVQEMSEIQIISLGQLVADIVVRPVDKFPQIGTADGVEAIELRTGGCGLNTAMTLKKLGMSVGLAGRIGQDVFGKFLARRIEAIGLDASGVKIDAAGCTSCVIVMVSSSGERSFLYACGGNEELCLEDIDFDWIGRAKILHVGGQLKLFSLKTDQVLKRAKEDGLVVSLDTDWDTSNRWLETVEPCLGYTDIFMSSIEEARLISQKETPQQISKFFSGYGIKIVVLKMGREGCYIRTGQEVLTLPGYKVEVVDTTGAGDAFAAGFLAGFEKGWDMEKCGRLGCACGALCVTKVGTTDGLRNLDETLRFMDSGFPLARE